MELVSNNDLFNLYLKLVAPNPTWHNILPLIEHLTIDVCKALPYFYVFTGCDTVSSFNGKGKCTFFDTWMESEKIKVNVKDIENISLNEMRKHQFIQSTSNDLKKIAPSSDAFNMHSLRAAHTAGFEWVECLHNVLVPDPSVRGYVLKDMFVPKWLSKVSTFNVAEFLQTCKCKTAKCVTCKCAKLGIMLATILCNGEYIK